MEMACGKLRQKIFESTKKHRDRGKNLIPVLFHLCALIASVLIIITLQEKEFLLSNLLLRSREERFDFARGGVRKSTGGRLRRNHRVVIMLQLFLARQQKKEIKAGIFSLLGNEAKWKTLKKHFSPTRI